MKVRAKNKVCTIYSFLSAAKGNWRNSIFIECGSCLYGKQLLCPGFLLNSDSDGQPVVIPVDIIRKMTGMDADKEECIAVISRKKFETLYAVWLEWQIDLPKECSLLQIANRNHCSRSDGKRPCC